LVVVNVADGLKEQTRRHLCIAALLGVRTAVVAVNKMDTVDWSESAFRAVLDDLTPLTERLGFSAVVAIPVSALKGENVVERSEHIEWYDGPTVLQALEASNAGSWAAAHNGARLPIQWVLRQNGGGRTYAGMINGATMHVGDTVTLLPAGVTTTITGIRSGTGARNAATPGLSVDLDLEHETDAGRSDMLATEPLPTVTKEFEATICWFGETPMTSGQRLRLKHTTRATQARVSAIAGAVDIETLGVTDASSLALNDIGIVTIQTADALVVDQYSQNRVTGSFVLIDPVTNATVAAGMIGRAAFL